MGCSGAIRESIDREDFRRGEYAVEGVLLGVRKGELGCELTRRMSSDIGVDFIRDMENARETPGVFEAEDKEGAGFDK